MLVAEDIWVLPRSSGEVENRKEFLMGGRIAYVWHEVRNKFSWNLGFYWTRPWNIIWMPFFFLASLLSALVKRESGWRFPKIMKRERGLHFNFISEAIPLNKFYVAFNRFLFKSHLSAEYFNILQLPPFHAFGHKTLLLMHTIFFYKNKTSFYIHFISIVLLESLRYHLTMTKVLNKIITIILKLIITEP